METPVSSIVQTGDLGGQKVAMGIDVNAMAHIMSILTDLYSDPQMAVIREYSTNARDSHIEVGKSDVPIEIITPSAMSPYFKVIDHGIGLSVDDITTMYSQYGASTKRNTNEQTGMLGLGAKSALTLVPQFNLTTVKNGVKAFVSISRSADGSGQMEIIDTRATDEGNGVEISIPIPRNHTFGDKVRKFFKFWPEGTVLVDGKAPERVTGRPVGTNFIIDRSLGQDYVVMGNVAYPVNESLWKDNTSYTQLGIVAYVNIGDVNFTPSREALQYTPRTKETIRNLQTEFANGLYASVTKDIADASTYSEAWKRFQEWKRTFGNRLVGQITYKGATIPNDISFARDTAFTGYARSIEGKQFSLTANSRNRYASNIRSINPDSLDANIFIVDFAASLKMSPIQREKAAIYVQQKGLKALNAVVFHQSEFITDKDNLKFLDGIHIVKWEEIAKIKVQRNVSTNRIIRTDPYDVMDEGGSTKQVRQFDTSKPIVYFSTAVLQYPTWIHKIIADTQLVVLSKNRWDKFQRDFPTALHWKAAVKQAQQKIVDTLSEADKILWHHAGSRWTVKSLDETQIDDPELVTFITVLKTTTDLSPAGQKLKNTLRNEMANFAPEVPDNPLTKYPLLGNINGADMEHVYWYINSYFATLNNKEN